MAVKNTGTLFLVATPIGNLEDITFRAIKVLKEVDLIACEDTRTTLKLLNHYNIKNKLTSFHEFNQSKKTNLIISLLKDGKNIALVSDAGTPGIQDPGEELVSRSIKEKIKVTPIPGACAFVSALISSGFSTSSFTFYGYLPHKEKNRTAILNEIKNNSGTSILYESPHKLNKTLNDLGKFLEDRKICIAREITKIFEEIKQGNIKDFIEKITINPKTKGEHTIIIEGKKDKKLEPEKLKEILKKYFKKISSRELIKKMSAEYGFPKNLVYKTYLEMNKFEKNND